VKNKIENLEERRIRFQRDFDSRKSNVDRNRLGQYATPNEFAKEILSETKKYLPKNKAITFMDPALGSGSFYSAFLSEFENICSNNNYGIEIDSELSEYAKSVYGELGLNVINKDFTSLEAKSMNKIDLLVSNPPYSRHHHISTDIKARITSWVKAKYGIKVSKLSGLHCYFVYLAQQFLKENGIAVWLVPSEFLDVNFGKSLKQYLKQEVQLLRIHRFSPEDLKFNDALVSSLIVWYKNCKPEENDKIKFTSGSDISNPIIHNKIKISELDPDFKWSNYFRDYDSSYEQKDKAAIKNLFTIKRGIASGNNKFFILSLSEIEEKKISLKYFRPILPPPKGIESNIIKSDNNGNPILNEQLFLLDTDLPLFQIKEESKELYDYLLSGIDAKVNEGYLCKNRNPWYSQEQREEPMFVCNYIGRNNKTAPFRFLLNESKAITTNSFLGLYPKPILKRLNIDFRNLLIQLNSIQTEELIAKGRSYGGGMYKLEPKELSNVELVLENEIFQELELSEQLTLFEPKEEYAS